MGIDALSTVVAPSLLWSKGKNPVEDESVLGIGVLRGVLEGLDEYLEVPRVILERLKSDVGGGREVGKRSGGREPVCIYYHFTVLHMV